MGLASRRGWRAFCQTANDLGEPLPKPWQLNYWWRDSLAKRFVSLFDAKTLAAGKRLWVEKTPGHVFHVPLINRFAPDAKFIHLIRDGKDVVASLWEVTHKHPQSWFGAWDLDQCIDYWNRAIDSSLKWSAHADHLVVDYERLTRDPQRESRRLCDFLGMAHCDEMTNQYSDTASNIVRPGEVWKSNINRAISNQHLCKYNTLFDDQQRQRIESVLATSTYDQLVVRAE